MKGFTKPIQQNLNLGLNFLTRQNIDWKGAVGGFAPACSRQERASVRPRAFGALANLDLLPACPKAGFFWVKPKERRKKIV